MNSGHWLKRDARVVSAARRAPSGDTARIVRVCVIAYSYTLVYIAQARFVIQTTAATRKEGGLALAGARSRLDSARPYATYSTATPRPTAARSPSGSSVCSSHPRTKHASPLIFRPPPSSPPDCGTHQIPTPPLLQIKIHLHPLIRYLGLDIDIKQRRHREKVMALTLASARGHEGLDELRGVGVYVEDRAESVGERPGEGGGAGREILRSRTEHPYRPFLHDVHVVFPAGQLWTPPIPATHARRARRPRVPPIVVPRRAVRRVHRIAFAGKAAGKDVGMWFGPSAAASAIRLSGPIFAIQDELPTWPGADDADDLGLESVLDPEEGAGADGARAVKIEDDWVDPLRRRPRQGSKRSSSTGKIGSKTRCKKAVSVPSVHYSFFVSVEDGAAPASLPQPERNMMVLPRSGGGSGQRTRRARDGGRTQSG
ncbi:hypothetical protein DFH09DRAFT_1354689, partial [Mycena vulgaris]